MTTECVTGNHAIEDGASDENTIGEITIRPTFAQCRSILSAFDEVGRRKMGARVIVRIVVKDGKLTMYGADRANVRLSMISAYVDDAEGVELDVEVNAVPLLDALKAVKKKAQGVDLLVRNGGVRCRYYEKRGDATESTSFVLEPTVTNANFTRTIDYVNKNVRIPGDEVAHIEADTAELVRMCKAVDAFHSNWKSSLNHALRFKAGNGAWTAQDSDGEIVMRPATFKSNVEGGVDKAMYPTDYLTPALGAMGKTATLMMKDEFPAIIRDRKSVV